MTDDLSTLPLASSLREARAWLRERLPVGARCPCCGQFAKIYRRKLNSGMSRAMITIYRRFGTAWVDLPREIPFRVNEETKLRQWGLMEEGPTRGVWRVTERGAAFVLGQLAVPSHAETYNGTQLRLNGDPITIREALGSHFDYDELMATPGHLPERN